MAETRSSATGARLGLLFGPSIFGVSAAGVALPEAAASLHVDAPASAWILTVHALALGVGTALFGRLGDTIGIRRVLLAGSALLVAGAAACVLAPDLGTVLAGRFVLAAGSGAMTSSAVTLSVSADPRRRGAVLAAFGAVIALFAGSATAVGGLSTAALSWRAAVVLPVLSIIGVVLSVPLAVERARGGRVDVVGAALVTMSAAALLVLLQSASLHLGPIVVLALAVFAGGAACLLTDRVRRRPEGFVPSVILNARYLVACAVGAGVFGGLFSAMYAVPQLLVRAHGWSVLGVGAALLPGALLGAIASRVAGRMPAGTARHLLVATAAATALLLCTAGITGGPVWLLLAGTSAAFSAFALTQVVMTGTVAASVGPEHRGAALGLLNLTFMIGGAVGSAAAGGLSGPLGVAGSLAVAAVLPLVAALIAIVEPARRRPAPALIGEA